jgi:hypothetical protein
MEAIRSYETLVTTYKTTRRHNPEDNNRQIGQLIVPLGNIVLQEKSKKMRGELQSITSPFGWEPRLMFGVD